MHFTAFVALAVVASSTLGLAARVPNSHPQIGVASRSDDGNIVIYGTGMYSSSKRSSDRVLDSVTTKRDDDSIIQNRRSTPLSDRGVQGTGSDNNQGIASNTGRQAWFNGIWSLEPEGANSNKDEVTEGTSSDNTKRYAGSVIPQVYNVKRQPDAIVISKEDGTYAF